MDRKFGVQIENIIKDGSSNHIVLKSRSFSFENKQKNQKPLPRRISYAIQKPLIPEQPSKQKQHSILPQYFTPCLLHMAKMEKTCPKFDKDFISKQLKIQKENMLLKKRSQVLDWLIRIHFELRLFPQTLFTAVTYMDRFFFRVQNPESMNIKLLAITSLFIAGKFQQTYRIPCLKHLKQRTGFTHEQILQMEEQIIDKLEFNLIVDSSYRFMEALAAQSNLSKKNTFIAHYILEISLTDTRFYQYSASLMGSAVVYLVHKIRKICPGWSAELKELTGYEESDLRQCAKQLCSLLEQSQTLQNIKSIKKKFSLPNYCQASKIRLQRKNQ